MTTRPAGESKARQARYLELAEILSREIAEGRFEVGSLLPTELELCERFSVSRYTVREALRRLFEAGMVRRRPGVGTRVEARMPRTRYVETISSMSDLGHSAAETSLRVRSTREVAADTVPGGVAPRGSRWLRVDALRESATSELPIGHVRIYLHADYAGVQAHIGVDGLPVYALVERQFGLPITGVEQEFAAAPVAPAIARLLKMPQHWPALTITRRYYSGDKLIEVAVNTHPGIDRYRYAMSLKLEGRHEAIAELRV